MVYCQKCGTKNDEDAEFCKKCSTELKGTGKISKKEHDDKCEEETELKGTGKISKKEHDDKCEEECAVGKQSPYAKFFWGFVVILVGLWIMFSMVLPRTEFGSSLPIWLTEFDFWWLIGLIIAVAIIVTGLRIIFSGKD